ncbi:MAG: hypothetical protein Q9227_004508 [Pyrenula ochraceoflavens]
MLLQSDKEIAGCISDIGVPFTPANLQKPNPQHIQLIFEWLAELLMNATRETIDPAMRAAAEEVCGDFMEAVPVDTRNLMGFFMSLRKLLIECGVHDFSFSDLVRPTHPRLVKIFSYVINFVRFRESQTAVIDENFNKSESTKERTEALYAENQDMEQRLENMKRNRQAMELQVKEKMKRNEEVKAKLIELNQSQKGTAEQYERLRAERTKKQKLRDERNEKLVKSRQECEKLKPYVLQSPSTLQSTLSELSDSLARDKGKIDMLERRTRALQTSSDSFGVVTNDVQGCVKVLEDISAEVQKEEEEDSRASKNREALAERGNNVREVEQQEKLLARQLARWEERTEDLRKKSKEKQRAAQDRMDELRAIQKQLREERADKGREMERRRVRIEQTEKKMADLKENIENEVHSAHEEYLKLESHIKLYITEMEQCI